MNVEMTQTATTSASGEKGAVSIKAVLIFTFLIIAIVGLIKIVPVYVEEQKVLHDADEIANKASLGSYSKEKIQTAILGVIKENDLPEGSISLVSQTGDRAEVSVKYSRAIDFFVTTYNWDVDHTSVGKPVL